MIFYLMSLRFFLSTMMLMYNLNLLHERSACSTMTTAIATNRRMMGSTRRRRPTTIMLITVALLVFWCAIILRAQQLLETHISRATSLQEAMTTNQHQALPVKTAKKLQSDFHQKDNVVSKNTVKFGVKPKQQTARSNEWQRAVSNSSNASSLPASETPATDVFCTNCTRYIVFKPIPFGQGTGQAMNGLLAAHLLGEEFNRIVCVTPTYKPFHVAFESVHPQAIQDCPSLKLQRKPKLISLINYNYGPDECKLKEELSSEKQIVYIVGNSYPRWPTVPDNYFTHFFKPTATLKNALPWTKPPSTVVHLRKADRDASDPRLGLDTKTLQALGKALPSNTFLVTNNVNWFDYFSGKFQWTHPNWRAVRHNAFKSFLWGQRGKDDLSDKDRSDQAQDLQMWSDWYSILCAKRVWHTHSDFSLSAIHWMNVESKTIMGVDEAGELKLLDEPWIRETRPPRLKDRGPEDLVSCKETHKASVV